MLRNRSRVMTGKQALMADQTSLPSPTQSGTSSVSSFLGSPRIFNGLLARTLCEPESAMSPTSTLDTKPFSKFVHPFGPDQNLFKSPNNSSLENKHTYEKVEGVGLAIVDSLSSEKNVANALLPNKPSSKMVLSGAKLKVQIPPPLSCASTLSPGANPKSPADFGIKTRNLHFLCPPSGFGSPIKAKVSPHELAAGLTLTEMELSEDYTCVITHGPNPKTTHIFDDCVVENCCGVGKLSDLGEDHGFSPDQSTSLSASEYLEGLQFLQK